MLLSIFALDYENYTDISTIITAGIERILRMVQAIVMVVLSQPLLQSGFFKLVALGNQHVWTEPRIASTALLTDLRSNVALVRRFFRMFRFLESFRAAHMIYTSFYAPSMPPPPLPASSSPTAPNLDPAPDTTSRSTNDEKVANKTPEDSRQAEPTPHAQSHHVHGPHCRHHQDHHKPRDPNTIPTEAWLDIFSRTFNAMYLLLETLTLIDALRLPGFSLWGAAWFSVLHVEGQRFWFFALVCGFFSGLLKMVKLVAHGPVPRTGEGYGTGEKSAEGAMPEWQRQRERMRRVVYAQRERRKAWKREIRTTGYKLARRCVADCLDLAVPGSVVGWVRVQAGTVGVVMVISTWLTGLEVWERCGREVGRL